MNTARMQELATVIIGNQLLPGTLASGFGD